MLLDEPISPTPSVPALVIVVVVILALPPSDVVVLAPTIVTGAITLGFVQQIIRAFGRVETSLQYLVRSWPIIVELISVWKRLREFEYKLKISKTTSEQI